VCGEPPEVVLVVVEEIRAATSGDMLLRFSVDVLPKIEPELERATLKKRGQAEPGR